MNTDTFNKKYMNFANEISSTTSRGTSGTFYNNQPVRWIGEFSDAAKDTFFFLDAVNETMAPEGTAQLVIQKRDKYPASSDVSFDTTEPTTSNISNYGTNHVDGVVLTPSQRYKKAAVTMYGQRITNRDLVKDKMDELSEALADNIDSGIATALGDATQTTSGAAGAMTLYGGVASSDATLVAGNVLTLELANKAEALMRGKYAYYWNSGTWTRSSDTKNPWKNARTDPYVCMIGPSQLEAFRNSDNFIDVARYGNDVVLSTGEIGRTIFGTRIIVSNNVESVAATGTGPDGTTTVVDMSRCIFMKGRKAYTHAWWTKPTFTTYLDEEKMQKGIVLHAFFGGSVIHADAVICIDVADN